MEHKLKIKHGRILIKNRKKNKKIIDNIELGMIIKDMCIVEIVHKENKSIKKRKYYKCMCTKCGRERISRDDAIKKGVGMKHEHCSQLITENDKQFYRKWSSMRTRTSNPSDPDYMYYGGRGISSKTYDLYIDFYDDLFESYKEHCSIHGKSNTTLDRKDVNGNYEPNNVRWATRKEQSLNTRQVKKIKAINEFEELNFDSIGDCARYFGVGNATIMRRVNNSNIIDDSRNTSKELNYKFYEV